VGDDAITTLRRNWIIALYVTFWVLSPIFVFVLA
jgi:hypothetical protein